MTHVSLARLAHLATATLLAVWLAGAHAADIRSAPQDTLAEARAQIAARNWAGAIQTLRQVNDTGSADWNNLMGYCLRKARTPDLAGSERHYDAALRIDPQHRGALEYSGELYLMKGELARARQRLATLGQVCAQGCEEYLDLKKAIERYEAAGQKYLPGDE